MWFLNFTLFSHFIHIIFICLLHFWARDPDPGPKSHIFVIFLVIFFSYYFHIFVKTSFSGLSIRTIFTSAVYFDHWSSEPSSIPGPVPPLWGPGPGPRPQNVQIIWKIYEKIWKSCDFSISHYFHIFIILFSYFNHIFGLGAQIRAPKVIFLSYSWSYFFHIIFIFLWKPSFLACPYGQSLQTISYPHSLSHPSTLMVLSQLVSFVVP